MTWHVEQAHDPPQAPSISKWFAWAISNNESPSATSNVCWVPSLVMKVICNSSPGLGFFRWPCLNAKDVPNPRILFSRGISPNLLLKTDLNIIETWLYLIENSNLYPNFFFLFDGQIILGFHYPYCIKSDFEKGITIFQGYLLVSADCFWWKSAQLVTTTTNKNVQLTETL